jgi:hypothetical protein
VKRVPERRAVGADFRGDSSWCDWEAAKDAILIVLSLA